jgi:porphobilinogen synthase
MLSRVELRRSDFVVPVFVCEGQGVKKPVASMPGVHQMSVDVAADWLGGLAGDGFGAYIAFGVIDRAKKDAAGVESLNADNVVCRLLRETKRRETNMLAMTDLCLCEYTDHGHCGPIDSRGATVDNDATLELLAQQAVNHATAGADVIAPSGMMDGTVAAVRRGLDVAGFDQTPILSYAVKYASGFYGPFRDAADSAPAFGDRRSYQMDPARGIDEALREIELDTAEGADILMVKPAIAYLDVIAAVRHRSHLPIVAYQVSGEYAMIEAAAANGWIDRDRVLLESLTAIKRAGADLIITYYADVLRGLVS